MHIAVIGAGIGGLAVAKALDDVGIPAHVYEQATKFERIGAGIHMSPNAVKVLLGLGVTQDVIDTTAYLRPSSTHRDAYTGELTADIELGQDAISTYGAPYTLWHRGDLHAALAALLPPERVRRGKKAVGLTPKGAGVEVTFSDGSAVTADAIIAADGVHSIARSVVFKVPPPRFTGRVAYRTVVPLASVGQPDLDPSCKWWGTDRHFVHYRVGPDGQEIAFTTSVPDENWNIESWSARGDVDQLRREFADFHPHVHAILGAVTEVNKWAIHTRDPLESWVVGPIVLLGDACHTMPPYMAQGAATSLEDAVVLARCVAELDGDVGGLPSAFHRYELLRKPRTTAIQAGANANTWGRYGWDAGWVFGYDAYAEPLSPRSGASTT